MGVYSRGFGKSQKLISDGLRSSMKVSITDSWSRDWAALQWGRKNLPRVIYVLYLTCEIRETKQHKLPSSLPSCLCSLRSRLQNSEAWSCELQQEETKNANETSRLTVNRGRFPARVEISDEQN